MRVLILLASLALTASQERPDRLQLEQGESGDAKNLPEGGSHGSQQTELKLDNEDLREDGNLTEAALPEELRNLGEKPLSKSDLGKVFKKMLTRRAKNGTRKNLDESDHQQGILNPMSNPGQPSDQPSGIFSASMEDQDPEGQEFVEQDIKEMGGNNGTENVELYDEEIDVINNKRLGERFHKERISQEENGGGLGLSGDGEDNPIEDANEPGLAEDGNSLGMSMDSEPKEVASGEDGDVPDGPSQEEGPGIENGPILGESMGDNEQRNQDYRGDSDQLEEDEGTSIETEIEDSPSTNNDNSLPNESLDALEKLKDDQTQMTKVIDDVYKTRFAETELKNNTDMQALPDSIGALENTTQIEDNEGFGEDRELDSDIAKKDNLTDRLMNVTRRLGLFQATEGLGGSGDGDSNALEDVFVGEASVEAEDSSAESGQTQEGLPDEGIAQSREALESELKESAEPETDSTEVSSGENTSAPDDQSEINYKVRDRIAMGGENSSAPNEPSEINYKLKDRFPVTGDSPADLNPADREEAQEAGESNEAEMPRPSGGQSGGASSETNEEGANEDSSQIEDERESSGETSGAEDMNEDKIKGLASGEDREPKTIGYKLVKNHLEEAAKAESLQPQEIQYNMKGAFRPPVGSSTDPLPIPMVMTNSDSNDSRQMTGDNDEPSASNISNLKKGSDSKFVKFSEVQKYKMFDEMTVDPVHVACIAKTDLNGPPDMNNPNDFEREYGLRSENFKLLLKYMAGENNQDKKIPLNYPVLIKVMPHINNTITRTTCIIISHYDRKIPPAMENHFAVMELPQPNHRSIQLITVGPMTKFVRTYNGVANDYVYRKQAKGLLDTIITSGLYSEVDLNSYCISIAYSPTNSTPVYSIGFVKTQPDF